MGWYNFWIKQEPSPKVVEESLVKNNVGVKVQDYSPRKYFAYWEVLNEHTPYGYIAEVRFMKRTGGVLEVHVVEGPTKANVQGLVAKLVNEKMENFKV